MWIAIQDNFYAVAHYDSFALTTEIDPKHGHTRYIMKISGFR
jgi:hypothetical protein